MKDFIADIVKKIPIPMKFTIDNKAVGIVKVLQLHFQVRTVNIKNELLIMLTWLFARYNTV